MTAITERDLIEESIGLMEIEEDEDQEDEEEAVEDAAEEEVEETSVGNDAAEDESGSDHNSFSVNDSDWTASFFPWILKISQFRKNNQLTSRREFVQYKI